MTNLNSFFLQAFKMYQMNNTNSYTRLKGMEQFEPEKLFFISLARVTVIFTYVMNDKILL